jgi:hypothetical protein
MATNFFFNNFKASQEQLLLENLVIESIKIYGQDMYYVPRKLNNYDPVYGADDISTYDMAYPIEMYIRSVDGFTGDGEFLSKFGVEIRNQVVFSVARRVFAEEVGEQSTMIRPNEGDIIYFPLNQRCFIIRFVNKYEMFYQLGAIQTWEMTCEVFEYSDEKFNTGIPEIDRIAYKHDTDIFNWTIMDQAGNMLLTETGDYLILEHKSVDDIVPNADNEDIQDEGNTFIDFDVKDPFSEGGL